MILHPGVLGLLIGGVLVAAMMVSGSLIGLSILRNWDPSSSSERQLALERRTYLVSVLVGVALWIEIGSALLFVLQCACLPIGQNRPFRSSLPQ